MAVSEGERQPSGADPAARGIWPPSRDFRIIALVSTAHFVSHFYFLVLPPLLGAVRAEYGVSYTKIGLALTSFNVVTAALQTPAGFLVDRFGARAILVAGLGLSAGSLAGAGLVNSFWFLVVAFAVAGLGNTVFHPADYAILSRTVSPHRLGQAFAVHTFAGWAGASLAPPIMLMIQPAYGWRGGFLAAAIIGLGAVVALTVQPESLFEVGPLPSAPTPEQRTPQRRPALFSPPILINLVLFVFLAVGNSSLSNYSVVALETAYGTPGGTANAALSAYLMFTAAGVLLGGVIASRYLRHDLVAGFGLVFAALASMLLASVEFGAAMLMVVMSVGGLFNGLTMPSRDMMVRAVAPEGSVGAVFGFVTTGFNIGAMATPLICGALLDHGAPRSVFIVSAASFLAALLTLGFTAIRTGRRA